MIDDYGKNGITPTSWTFVTVSGNTSWEEAKLFLVMLLRSVQIGFGARDCVRKHHSMHDYDPPDFVALRSALLPGRRGSARQDNTFAMNEQNILHRRGGPFADPPSTSSGIGEAGQGRRHYARQEEDMRLRILVAVSPCSGARQPERRPVSRPLRRRRCTAGDPHLDIQTPNRDLFATEIRPSFVGPRNDALGPYPSTTGDSGTCGPDWATDTSTILHDQAGRPDDVQRCPKVQGGMS